jgi:hypothetical protein
MDMSDKTIRVTAIRVNDVKQTSDCDVSVFQILSENIQRKIGEFSLSLNLNYQNSNDPDLLIKLTEILEEIPE